MKRITLISIIILIPALSFGRIGWWFQNYSIQYGQSYYKTSFYHSIELQFEYQRTNCTSHTAYKGLAFSSNFNNILQEYGLKGFINPTRISFGISRRIRAFPYLYFQQNVMRENQEIKTINLNTRPGIGITTVIGFGNSIVTRIQLQGGYSCNRYYLDNGNGLVIEFKIGIGIDPININKKEKH